MTKLRDTKINSFLINLNYYFLNINRNNSYQNVRRRRMTVYIQGTVAVELIETENSSWLMLKIKLNAIAAPSLSNQYKTSDTSMSMPTQKKLQVLYQAQVFCCCIPWESILYLPIHHLWCVLIFVSWCLMYKFRWVITHCFSLTDLTIPSVSVVYRQRMVYVKSNRVYLLHWVGILSTV